MRLVKFLAISAVCVVGFFHLPAWSEERLVECGTQALEVTRCPIKIDGLVELLEQVSRSSCDLGRTWGYDDQGIWVSQRCRGVFRLLPGYPEEAQKFLESNPPAQSGPPLARSSEDISADQIAEVYCASHFNRYQHCDAETRGRTMHLVHEFSNKACDYGRTWGYNSRGIWVDRGCVGLFRMKRRFVPPPRIVRVVCESNGSQRISCPVANLGYAQLANSYSGSACVKDQTWGLQRGAIWVKDGCRALFDVIELGTGLPAWMYGRFAGYDAVSEERLVVEISINGLLKAWRNDRPIHIDLDGDLLVLGGQPYEVAKSRAGFRAETTLAGQFRSIGFHRE